MIACLNDGRVQSNFCACTFFENTNKILILNTKKDNFEKTENYDHANKDHKYIVFMACNANIASTETKLVLIRK